MTTNKPEVSVVYSLRTDESDKMVLLSDYEILQAECEKLRKDSERYWWLADNCVSDWIGEEGPVLVHAKPWNANWRSELDDAIDAAIQENPK